MSVAEDVIWLGDIECHRSEMAGGKGASLGKMTSTGMPVPPGFVVRAGALGDSLSGHGVLEEVSGLARSFEGGVEGARIAGEIQEIVLASPPSKELAEHISMAYQSLGADVPVAVRSSACAEDGESASFAGQQETFLNVMGPERVLEAVVRCWASFFTERALFYRRSKGSLTDLGMAVVVQQQIASDKSGVMFTTDPIRQRSDQMVIEAGYGLGEALVSGLITPDNYVARRDGTLKKARLGQQDQMIVRVAAGGTTTVTLDEGKVGSQVLDDDEISQLVAVGLELEAAFGSPQDIEWAFEADRLYVLQSRPITT